MEACATAHYWARELTKLGHKVRLMPAKDVKAQAPRDTLRRDQRAAANRLQVTELTVLFCLSRQKPD